MSGEMLSWKMLTVPIAEFMKLLELLASSEKIVIIGRETMGFAIIGL